jgi:hypothetical protein
MAEVSAGDDHRVDVVVMPAMHLLCRSRVARLHDD